MTFNDDTLKAALASLEGALASLIALHKQGVDVGLAVLGVTRAIEVLEEMLPEEGPAPSRSSYLKDVPDKGTGSGPM